jgi:SAM-dependent methyltransferase
MGLRPAHQQWLETKLANYYPDPEPEALALLYGLVTPGPADAAPVFGDSLYDNPFTLDDLMILDSDTLTSILHTGAFGLSAADLAHGLAGGPVWVIERFARFMPSAMAAEFRRELASRPHEDPAARRRVLDDFFWDLVYWHHPEWYEELTSGELPVPGLFARAAADLRDRTVLEVGAGTGRATFPCLEQQPLRLCAVEPAPGMRQLLQRKVDTRGLRERVTVLSGRFDAVPLPDDSVDTVFAYSAFTSDPGHGGEPGLAELKRVTRPGGVILIFWPPLPDYGWLAAHGFEYIAIPMDEGPYVHFTTLAQAQRCADRFYARSEALHRYLRETQRHDIPFWVTGFTPPHDYCRLVVRK